MSEGLYQILMKEKKIVDKDFSLNQFENFIILIKAHKFVIELEDVKDTFMDCLDETKFLKRSDIKRGKEMNDFSIGEIIWKINNKLYPIDQVSGRKKSSYVQLRKVNSDLFFIDFRNAIIHRAYDIKGQILTYQDSKGNDINLTAKNFEIMKEQFGALRFYIYNHFLSRGNLTKIKP